MEHEFDPAAFKKKLAQSGQHSAGRATEANRRVGSISNQDFARWSPDQIRLGIRSKLVFGCPVDLKSWTKGVDQGVLLITQMVDGHGSLASLGCHHQAQAVGPDHTDAKTTADAQSRLDDFVSRENIGDQGFASSTRSVAISQHGRARLEG